MIGTRIAGFRALAYYLTLAWRDRLRPWRDWSPWLRRREPQEVAGGYEMVGILVGLREISRRPER